MALMSVLTLFWIALMSFLICCWSLFFIPLGRCVCHLCCLWFFLDLLILFFIAFWPALYNFSLSLDRHSAYLTDP
jgi:hypothetical protein